MIRRPFIALMAAALAQGCSAEVPESPPGAGSPVQSRVERRLDSNLERLDGDEIGVTGLGAFDPSTVPDLDSYGWWVDLDGDDIPELVASSAERGRFEGWQGAEVWRRSGAAMVRDTTLTGHLPRRLRASVDLDGDGRVDLVGTDDRQWIAWGAAHGWEAPALLTIDQLPNSGLDGHPFSGIFVDDVDDDGLLDLVLGFGCCQGNCRDLHVLQQTAPRRFVDRIDWVERGSPVNSYAVISLRAPAGGRLSAIVGHAGCSSDGDGDSFRWSSGPVPDFRISALSPALRGLSAHSPMGLFASTPTNDGRLVLNVSLGESQAVLVGTAPGDFATRQEFSLVNDKGLRVVPWGTVLADVDADGLDDWITANADDAEVDTLAERRDGQEQGITMAYGEAPGSFATPFALTNLGHIGQHRTVAAEDIDGDGAPEFAFGSQTGGVEVLRTIPSGNAVAVKLAGTSSGSIAPNARIRVVVGGGRPEQHHLVVAPAQPMIFTPPVTFIGLGPQTQAERLEVTWPTGIRQQLTNVAAAQRLTITEPPAFRITPDSRQLPADGASRFELVMMPRDASGGLVRDPVPQVGLDGPGAIEGSPVWQDDGWHLFIRAPQSPGETRVEMRFGELALQIRPRLVWE